MGGGHRRSPLSQAGWYLPVLVVFVLLVASCADDDDATTSTTIAVTTSPSPSTSSTSTSSSTSTTTSTSTSTSTSTTTTTVPKSSTSSVSSTRCVEVLQHGCEGEEVERLQRLLRTRIDGGVAVDGSFGDHTEAALRTFEQFNCPVATCTVDGRILIDGPEWVVLNDLPEPTTTTFEISI